MAFLKSLNVACNLNKNLSCKMPEGVLEVEIKVKTTPGKFTMTQNTHTRMEKFCTWENAQQCHAKSKKGRTPHKATSVHTENNTSGTDMPTSQEFGKPPLIFTDLTHATVILLTDLEGKAVQDAKFSGRYCEYCNRSEETCCWCFSSDWEQELDVSNPNPSIEISSSSAGRKPPAGWCKCRCKIIKATDAVRIPSPEERNQ